MWSIADRTICLKNEINDLNKDYLLKFLIISWLELTAIFDYRLEVMMCVGLSKNLVRGIPITTSLVDNACRGQVAIQQKL